MKYEELPVPEAYELQNAGGLVLVCTRGQVRAEASGASSGGSDSLFRYDLAPIAWCCPLDYAPVSRLLLVCDTGHKTYEDLVKSNEFAVALPTPSQIDLVNRTGSVSGRDVDKYAKFGIKAFAAHTIDAQVPEGVAGWLECRLLKVIVEGTSAVVMGEVLYAAARKDFWRERIHYVREGLMFVPGKEFAPERY
ncbi:MAG: flavin reductase [Rectinema sp.]